MRNVVGGVMPSSLPSGLQPQTAAFLNASKSAPQVTQTAQVTQAAQAAQTGNLPVGVVPGSGGKDQPHIDAPASNTGMYVFAAVTGLLVIGAVIKLAVSK